MKRFVCLMKKPHTEHSMPIDAITADGAVIEAIKRANPAGESMHIELIHIIEDGSPIVEEVSRYRIIGKHLYKCKANWALVDSIGGIDQLVPPETGSCQSIW